MSNNKASYVDFAEIAREQNLSETTQYIANRHQKRAKGEILKGTKSFHKVYI
jgi:hypothetical protein